MLTAASRASKEGGHDSRTVQSLLGSIAAGSPIRHTYLQVQVRDGLNGCRSVHASLFVLSIAERVKEGFGGTFFFLLSFLALTLHGLLLFFFLFPDTFRYFSSNFRASFVGTRVRGLDIDLPCSSFIISSTHFRRLLPEADTHPAFQLFAVHAQGKLPSYDVKHSPVLFDPIYVQPLPLLLPPRSNSFVRIAPKHVSDTLFPLLEWPNRTRRGIPSYTCTSRVSFVRPFSLSQLPFFLMLTTLLFVYPIRGAVPDALIIQQRMKDRMGSIVRAKEGYVFVHYKLFSLARVLRLRLCVSDGVFLFLSLSCKDSPFTFDR